MEYLQAPVTELAKMGAKGVSKLLWREVVVKRPWWKIFPAKPQFAPRWETVAAVAGVSMWALYRQTRKKALKIIIDPMLMSGEGMVPGSPLLTGGRMPDCQVAIAAKRGDTFMVVGAGIRLGNHLVTPTHNGHAGYEMYMLKETPNGQRVVKVRTEDELYIATDVSAFAVPEQDWSKLGVPKATTIPLPRATSVTVVSSCDGKYSVGKVQPSDCLIGRCVYTASTVPGFSGSAYMNGGAVVGMHCHGGTRGGGYEILYLWCRLKAALLTASDLGNPESSEDVMFGVAREDDWVEEPLANERAVVRSRDGNYHLTTAMIVSKMKALRKSQDWIDEMDADELEEELMQRDDYIPEAIGVGGTTYPGEYPRPAVPAGPVGQRSRSVPPQASTSSVALQVSIPTVQPKSTKTGCDFSKLPLKHMTARELRALSKRCWKQYRVLVPSTSRQTQVRQQSGKASVSN